ncbi:MAG: hypothetical protein PWQ63_247 [Methanolobus sp.]|jgi:hypothetical protein|nr:hypothetical protein [Methanolobus sp.]MDK2947087.1 hypothetical protein [Methanolobus sp.]
MKNEFGEVVPENVIIKGKELGCINCPKYIYRDGKYNNKFPASSIGGQKASRFRSFESANAHKVILCDGWVAFRSPSYTGVAVKGKRRSSVTSRSSAIIGGFDGATGLWKSLEEHRESIYSKNLRTAWDEILAICLSFKDKDVHVFSRRDGFSCIVAGLKVLQLKFENSGIKIILFKNIHNTGKRSVTQKKYPYIIRDTPANLPYERIEQHLKEQAEVIGKLRDSNSIGYMEKWLHNILIDNFNQSSIKGLKFEFLHYEVPLGKVKRRMQFGREHADIFAQDSSGSLVIIEVKENSSNLDDAIRQGISYLEWVDTYKNRLEPRVKELGWNVDLNSLKLFVIAPGFSMDLNYVKKNLGEEMKDYDVTVVLVNMDWYVKRSIEVNKIIKLNGSPHH